MAENSNGRGVRGKRKRRKNVFFGPIAFIIICAALALALSVFFRVSTITVEESAYYTDNEIIEASGLEAGDNLFFINKSAVISRIFSKLPYIAEASVERVMPNKVVIHVADTTTVGYVSLDSDKWVIDKYCKLLERSDLARVQGMIEIKSVTPVSPTVGEKLAAGLEESAKLEYLAEIVYELAERDMIKDITVIDMDNISNPEFYYLGRFTVKLGRHENTDYKLEVLLSAVSQLSESETGTMDLSIGKPVYFRPD